MDEEPPNSIGTTPDSSQEAAPVIAPVATVDSAISSGDEYRTWTDSTGDHSVEAEFLYSMAGTVTLKRKDTGEEIQLQLSQLSAEDQEWLRALARRRRADAPPRDGSRIKPAEPSQDSGESIPGIAAVDIHGNLTNKGFTLEKRLDPMLSEWKCTLDDGDALFIAEALGAGPTEIELVRGLVMNQGSGNTDELSGEFLGFLASLPYDGSQPARAAQWVRANVGRNAVTVIGGVQFQLIVNSPRAQMLRITKSP